MYYLNVFSFNTETGRQNSGVTRAISDMHLVESAKCRQFETGGSFLVSSICYLLKSKTFQQPNPSLDKILCTKLINFSTLERRHHIVDGTALRFVRKASFTRLKICLL